MKITVPGELLTDYAFIALFPIASADLKAKTNFETKAVQGAPDGSNRPMYRYGLKVLRLENGVPISEEQNVNIFLIEKIDIEAGVQYVPSGLTWLNHYNDPQTGRMTASVTVERLKRADQANKINVAELAGKLAASPAKPQHNN